MANRPTLKSRAVPAARLAPANDSSVDAAGKYMLYWMSAARRTSWNLGLDRALELAGELGKPLLVVETLSGTHPWASDRHHAFAIQGMVDNAPKFERAGIAYYPFVERRPPEAKELLVAVAGEACAVVADDFPIRSHTHDLRTLAEKVPVGMERIDSNGLMPLGAISRAYPSAYTFRRFLQKTLPDRLLDAPQPNPLARLKIAPPARLPREIRRRWPAASTRLLRGDRSQLAALPLDHSVLPVEMAAAPSRPAHDCERSSATPGQVRVRVPLAW